MSKSERHESAKHEPSAADPKTGKVDKTSELKDSDLDQVSGGATRGGHSHDDVLTGCGGGSG